MIGDNNIKLLRVQCLFCLRNRVGYREIVWDGVIVYKTLKCHLIEFIVFDENSRPRNSCSAYTAVKTAVDDNDTRVTDNANAIASLQSIVTALQASVTQLQNDLDSANSTISDLQNDLAVVQNNSVLDLDGYLTYDIDDNGYPTALFTGVNVQVINGVNRTWRCFFP